MHILSSKKLLLKNERRLGWKGRKVGGREEGSHPCPVFTQSILVTSRSGVTISVDRETEALKSGMPSSWKGLGTWQRIPLSLQNHWAHLCRSVVFLFPLFLTDILWPRTNGYTPRPTYTHPSQGSECQVLSHFLQLACWLTRTYRAKLRQ